MGGDFQNLGGRAHALGGKLPARKVTPTAWALTPSPLSPRGGGGAIRTCGQGPPGDTAKVGSPNSVAYGGSSKGIGRGHAWAGGWVGRERVGGGAGLGRSEARNSKAS